MISVTSISRICAAAVAVCCAYMAFVDVNNQIIWTIALVGWLPHSFDN